MPDIFTNPNAKLSDSSVPAHVYPQASVHSLQQSVLSLINMILALRTSVTAIEASLVEIGDTNRPSSSIARWLGDWVSGASYQRGDLVLEGSYLYVALRDTTGQPSATTTDWLLLSQVTRTDVFSSDFSAEFA